MQDHMDAYLCASCLPLLARLWPDLNFIRTSTSLPGSQHRVVDIMCCSLDSHSQGSVSPNRMALGDFLLGTDSRIKLIFILSYPINLAIQAGQPGTEGWVDNSVGCLRTILGAP